jgi:hypothetical protein
MGPNTILNIFYAILLVLCFITMSSNCSSLDGKGGQPPGWLSRQSQILGGCGIQFSVMRYFSCPLLCLIVHICTVTFVTRIIQFDKSLTTLSITFKVPRITEQFAVSNIGFKRTPISLRLEVTAVMYSAL